MPTVKEIWDEGAPIYDEIYANNVAYHRSHAAIVDLLPKTRPIDILDLGAGTGLLAARILDCLTASRVTSLEFSPNMLEVARQRLHPFGNRAQFICADMTTWQPDREYDAIVTCNALVYKDIDLGACYKKFARHLRLGGLVLNSTIVKSDDLPLFIEIAENAAPAAPPLSPEVVKFARTSGKLIANFGPHSLAFSIPVDEHLRLLADAGLTPSCPWHHLSQTIVAGLKREENVKVPA